MNGEWAIMKDTSEDVITSLSNIKCLPPSSIDADCKGLLDPIHGSELVI